MPESAPTTLQIGHAKVRVGTSGWSARTLTKETNWYPKVSMKAGERMAFYAQRFGVTELDATFGFLPTPTMTAGLVDKTPADFQFVIRGWSLLTGHPTFPDSIPDDLRKEVAAEHRHKRRMYPHYLSPGALDECWRRFVHSLQPMVQANRIGAVLLKFPKWFSPNGDNLATIQNAANYLRDIPVAFQLTNHRWYEGAQNESTLDLLEDLGASYVCSDDLRSIAEGRDGFIAVTSPLAVVRLNGRPNLSILDETKTSADEISTGTASDAKAEDNLDPNADESREEDFDWQAVFRYRYSDAILDEWRNRIDELAASADHVIVTFANAYRDDAVLDAQAFQTRLSATTNPVTRHA